MSAVLEPGNAAGASGRREWLPVLAGLALLVLPTLYELADWHWSQEEGAHGPIILAVVLWLVWRQRAVLFSSSTPASPALGYALLVSGLLLYVLGRSQAIILFEVGGLLPLLAGTLVAMRGASALRSLWFPILFLVFLIPLPTALVDALTGPLKAQVSQIAETLLYAAGLPVARSGVVLTVGPYELLVADACSGLQSMFSLSALGCLYLYVAGRRSVIHNAVMLASILPIAFMANIVRVLLLILVTYNFGDAAGQGFLHGAAGIVLLLVALSALFLLDAILARVARPRTA